MVRVGKEKHPFDLYFTDNPLVKGLIAVNRQIDALKSKTKNHYFQILFMIYRCPFCGGRLKISGVSQCKCKCGHQFDPTLVFQKSLCCRANLIRKTHHYHCADCTRTVPSKFLFDEVLFDHQYFQEKMRDYRNRKKEKLKRLKQLFARSRSSPLLFTETSDLDIPSGFFESLDPFIDDGASLSSESLMPSVQFNLIEYRQHILSQLSWNGLRFSEISTLKENDRRDRVGRFITVIFMQHDHEIIMDQLEDDILIQKVHYETDY